MTAVDDGAVVVPADRDEAEAYLLDELRRLAVRIEEVEAAKLALYDRRRDVYGLGRKLDPPIPAAKMAEAAGVSPSALVLSGQKGKARRRVT